jgi:ATP-grasp domain-containing protein
VREIIPKWIVHNTMLYNTSYKDLPDVIRNLGYDCYMVNNYSLMDDLDSFNLPNSDSCTIPYCTIELARQMKKYFGMYLNEQNLKYHVYTALLSIDPDLYLNNPKESMLTTYRNFKLNKDFWIKNVSGDGKSLFIRPDSGMKLFTGYAFDISEWDFQFSFLDQKMNDEYLMWVSPKQYYFWDEVRFIICDNQVIDGSRYSTDSGNTLIEDRHVHQEQWDLADKIAKLSWRVDDVYTCDICMTHNGAKLVEINSFSCAGWYGCNVEKVVKGVTEHTLKIYREQYG